MRGVDTRLRIWKRRIEPFANVETYRYLLGSARWTPFLFMSALPGPGAFMVDYAGRPLSYEFLKSLTENGQAQTND